MNIAQRRGEEGSERYNMLRQPDSNGKHPNPKQREPNPQPQGHHVPGLTDISKPGPTMLLSEVEVIFARSHFQATNFKKQGDKNRDGVGKGLQRRCHSSKELYSGYESASRRDKSAGIVL